LKCPNCGNELNFKTLNCPFCGFDGEDYLSKKIAKGELKLNPLVEFYIRIKQLDEKRKLKSEGLTCPKCKTKYFKDVDYCKECGVQLKYWIPKSNLNKELQRIIEELEKKI